MNFQSLFTNTLSPVQWLLLALVPPAIVMLYFLKLRRQPLEVPSTYLWSRTIEDLHVNSIWQKLRQSLLLLLQLLLIGLVMLACLRPGWQGTQLVGDRFVFVVDTSASMSATDVEPTRLAMAKKQVLALIEQMKAGDVGMVVSFSDVAHVEQQYTDNRRLLRARVEQIQGTNRTSDLLEALRVAEVGVNTGRTSDNAADSKDDKVAAAKPATAYIVSDGGFSQVSNFAIGNLTPKYIPIGVESPKNIGIVAFNVERNPERADQLQAFGRLENIGAAEETVDVELFLDGDSRDVQRVVAKPGESTGIKFDLPSLEKGELKLVVNIKDDFPLDNTVYAAVNPPRPSRVLLVTPRNDALLLALQTEQAAKVATVTTAEPAVLEDKQHQGLADAGYYDLIIYDQCAPPKMPQANTLFIGTIPPGDEWKAGEKSGRPPLIIDVDRAHPLTQLLELGRVLIAEAIPLTAPRGATTLIDADIGPICAIAPRQGFEDAVLGFEIVGTNEKGERYANSDWPHWYSFPVFVQNVLEYLGGGGAFQAAPSVRPGKGISLRAGASVERMQITSPSGEKTEVSKQGEQAFVYTDTSSPGIYKVYEGKEKEPAQQFAVNLFDSRESNLVPTAALNIGHNEVKSSGGAESTRKELWKWILLGGLVVLVFEWYVYNRRVYF